MKTTNNNATVTNFNRRAEIKTEIKTLRVEYKELVMDALKDYNDIISDESVRNINFTSTKAKNEFILNCKADKSDTLLTTVINYKIYNLTIQFNMSEAALKDALKFYLTGIMSKSSFKSEDKFMDAKKAAKEQFENMSKEDRKAAKETFVAGLK